MSTIVAMPGLVGVSADGTDVYFATYDTLVGQDRNGEALKIYDARTGGGFPFTPPVPPCVAADECHGPSSAAPADAADRHRRRTRQTRQRPARAKGGQAGKKHKKARHKRHHKKKHTPSTKGRAQWLSGARRRLG